MEIYNYLMEINFIKEREFRKYTIKLLLKKIYYKVIIKVINKYYYECFCNNNLQ